MISCEGMPNNRGLLMHQTLASTRFGPGSAARERLFAAVPEDTREILEARVMPSSWYDERHTLAVCRAVVDILGLGTEREIITLFREQQLIAYSRIYKMILPFMKPESLVQKSEWMWRRHHDTGDLAVEELRPDGAVIRFTGNPNICDEIYSLAVTGGIEAAITLTRTHNVRGKPEVISDDVMLLRMSWDA